MKEYHERTATYRFTLPVVQGYIQDDGRLAKLRYAVAFDNGTMYGWRMAKNSSPWHATVDNNKGYQLRYVVDLKWRGPRYGRSHDTLRGNARAVDVYVRLRRDFNYHA